MRQRDSGSCATQTARTAASHTTHCSRDPQRIETFVGTDGARTARQLHSVLFTQVSQCVVAVGQCVVAVGQCAVAVGQCVVGHLPSALLVPIIGIMLQLLLLADSLEGNVSSVCSHGHLCAPRTPVADHLLHSWIRFVGSICVIEELWISQNSFHTERCQNREYRLSVTQEPATGQ